MHPARGASAAVALVGRESSRARADRDLAWLAESGHALVTLDNESYPALLRDIPDPPAALYVTGDVETLWQPQVAIVGSRNPTAGGLENARAFTRALVQAGFTVTSGLALGIDGAAHAAAIEAGGRTVGVMGTGPDLVYPARNRALAARIAGSGTLVTEFPPGTPPLAHHFPRRNRIIAGLARIVVVVEAARTSGALTTARHALAAGREVMAVPGHPLPPNAVGVNGLLFDGARPVRSPDDSASAAPSVQQRAPTRSPWANVIAPRTARARTRTSTGTSCSRTAVVIRRPSSR